MAQPNLCGAPTEGGKGPPCSKRLGSAGVCGVHGPRGGRNQQPKPGTAGATAKINAEIAAIVDEQRPTGGVEDVATLGVLIDENGHPVGELPQDCLYTLTDRAGLLKCVAASPVHLTVSIPQGIRGGVPLFVEHAGADFGNVVVEHAGRGEVKAIRSGSASGTALLTGEGYGSVLRAGDGDGDAERIGGDGNAIRDGSGFGSATVHNGNGLARRDGDGHGDAVRTGTGDGNVERHGDGIGDARCETNGSEGHAVRTGAGFGHAFRTEHGDGAAIREGEGEGHAVRSGRGDGDARRRGPGIGGTARVGQGQGAEINETPGYIGDLDGLTGSLEERGLLPDDNDR